MDSAQRTDAPAMPSLLILTVFTAAVFVSALLLFAVQPMFTRMVLPTFGGSPQVWSVAMVFFQSMLLGGYAYAHFLMRTSRATVAVAVHLALLIAAGLTLPLSVARGWGETPTEWAGLWLLGLFVVSIGLPFFALSANNPLLQAWFVRTGHRDGKDPYFLYAASNLGSFLALLSYPVLAEPMLTLRDQNRVWSVGFWVLFLLIAGCGALLLRSPTRDAQTEEAAATPAPSWSIVGRWVFLAAVPSGLLVAVTAHITTDVSSVPLMWVIPLSLYLLTWVLVFQQRPLLPHRWMIEVLPFAIVGLVAMFAFNVTNLWLNLGGNLLAFVLIALACHGELARQRPSPEHLTTFYVTLSAGGMVGGLFAGLIAPYVFSWVAEYPILIALAGLCLPFVPVSWGRLNTLFWIAAVVIGIGILVPGAVFGYVTTDKISNAVTGVVLIIAGAALLLVRHPAKFAFAIAIALALLHVYPDAEEKRETVRSFFGVHKIYEAIDGQYRVLIHGTTVHGGQKLKDDSGRPLTGRPELITYYHNRSPMAQAIPAIRARKGGPIKVAVVGLGSGTLACFSEPGEDWRYFEIDVSIVDIARDRPRFTFLKSCAPDAQIILGDARLTLAREPDGFYDLIILDAYSSDAIPIHLATREAMALYKRKLAPNGAVITHISNRHLELSGVVAGIAAANGLKTWVGRDKPKPGKNADEAEDDDQYIYTSQIAISAAESEDIGALAFSPYWQFTKPDPKDRVWSDDYSNILGPLIKRLRM